MFGLGPQEVMILAVLGLLFFGGNLPKLGRSLGRTIIEFRKGASGIEDDIEDAVKEPEASPAQPAAARPPQRLSAPVPKFEDAPATPEKAQPDQPVNP